MGLPQHFTRPRMVGGDQLGEVDSVYWATGGQVCPCPVHQCVGTGQFDHVGADGVETDRI